MTDNPYLFQQVKERVDIVEAAERYGLSVVLRAKKNWCGRQNRTDNP